MKRVIVVALLVGAVGCKKLEEGNPSVSKVVTNVKKKVDDMVTEFELKELHLFMETARASEGRIPPASVTRAVVSKESPKLAKLLESGALVLVDSPKSDGLWAYEKDAPTRGGLVLTQQGIERKTAEEFAELIKGN